MRRNKTYFIIKITDANGNGRIDELDALVSSKRLTNLETGKEYTCLTDRDTLEIINVVCEHITHSKEEIDALDAALGITSNAPIRIIR